MKFRKGQTVYVIGANDKIMKATISHTHPKDELFPYELDLPVKNRFYPEDAVFATAEDAEAGLQKDHMERMTEALTEGKNIHLISEVKANPDGSFTDASGNKIGRFFELTEKQKKELDALCAKVDNYCVNNHLPYMMTVIMANKKTVEGSMIQARCTSAMPGPRTPPWLDDLWEIQEQYLGFGEEEN